MFSKIKQRLNKLERDVYKATSLNNYVDTLATRLNDFEDKLSFHSYTVSCGTCKCLINKTDAFRGESTVELCYPKALNGTFCGTPIETIIEHYFCLKCKPKKK